MSPLNGPTASPALVRALRHALRPLVRLMLASGVTYPIVSELLKSLFVEVSERHFRLDDRPTTDSRISLISGVHRKDVRRLRASGAAIEEVVPDTISFGGRLVATWLSDERFLDVEGRARPLPRTRSEGEPACFEDLVASRSTDIRPRVVLDEWLRLGIVFVDAHDRVVLNTEAFVPQTGLDEKLFFFAHNLHDHAAAATENLLGTGPARFERSLIFDGLPDEGVDMLDKRARQLGTKLLTELNRLAAGHESPGPESGKGASRLTCGVFFYSEPVEPPPRASDES